MSVTRSPDERPRTSQKWPRLSTSLPQLHPTKCAQCGCWDREEILTLWQECDEQDRPEARYVLLCEKCGDRLIEPHVRLYQPIDRNAPAPGAMEICADCRFRDGLWCAKAKCNGGEGVTITVSERFSGFIDGTDSRGRHWGRRVESYAHPPKACSGKVAQPEDLR